MTKEQFKKEWEVKQLPIQTIKACALKWGIQFNPTIHSSYDIRYKVLKAANVENAENFNPNIR